VRWVARTARNWRRYLAGLAFVGAVALLSSRTCEAESAEFEIHLSLGDQGYRVASVDAGLYGPDGDVLTTYQRNFTGAGAPDRVGPWKVRAAEGEYRVQIRVTTDRGLLDLERTVRAESGAVVSIPLADALANQPTPGDLDPDPDPDPG